MPWTFQYVIQPPTYGHLTWVQSTQTYKDSDSASDAVGDLVNLCATHGIPIAVQLISLPTETTA